MSESRCWFRKKRFGWGLEPDSPEGWAVTALFVIVEIGAVVALMPLVVYAAPWILLAWAF